MLIRKIIKDLANDIINNPCNYMFTTIFQDTIKNINESIWQLSHFDCGFAESYILFIGDKQIKLKFFETLIMRKSFKRLKRHCENKTLYYFDKIFKVNL